MEGVGQDSTQGLIQPQPDVQHPIVRRFCLWIRVTGKILRAAARSQEEAGQAPRPMEMKRGSTRKKEQISCSYHDAFMQRLWHPDHMLAFASPSLLVLTY